MYAIFTFLADLLFFVTCIKCTPNWVLTIFKSFLLAVKHISLNSLTIAPSENQPKLPRKISEFEPGSSEYFTARSPKFVPFSICNFKSFII